MEPARPGDPGDPVVSTAAYGRPNYGVLNRLKASARNCQFVRSVILKFLKIEKSTLYCGGPRRIPWSALQNWCEVVCTCAMALVANASGFHQTYMLFSS